MKIEIEIPDDLLTPLMATAKGFNVPMERAIAIVVCDWVARMDAEMAAFSYPCTPGFKVFDDQFTEETPEGYELASSYELSRSNHYLEFLSQSKFYAKRAAELRAENGKPKIDN